MKHHRLLLACFLIPLTLGGAWAQNSSQNSPTPTPNALGQLQKEEQLNSSRNDQKIQRIRIEDAGSRIDELRVGGETQSVTVQPKLDMPAWQVQPSDGARSRPEAKDRRGGEGGAQRVWNVMTF